MREIDQTPNPTKKEQDLYTLLEVVLEMLARGIGFSKIDLYRSHPSEFILEGGRILPPLRGLAGLGESVAQAIAAERLKGEFLSIEDLRVRSKASKTVVEALENHGALEALPRTNQLQFIDLQTFE
jgi:DNA polymerase-3 subunit alpha (Gram-positive type)